MEEEFGVEVGFEAAEVAVESWVWRVLLLVEDGAYTEEVMVVDGGGGGKGVVGEEERVEA